MDHTAVKRIGHGLLGLSTDVVAFERITRTHPELGVVVQAQSGLVLPQAATPFEALTWAITGQQINLALAVQLRRRLINLAGRAHSSGLWCYPEAQDVAMLTEDQLGLAKFSRAKAQTLLRISRMVLDGELPLDAWLTDGTPPDEVHARLLEIRGIGPWTANYSLLRGYGAADCSLHGDAAVKRALQKLLRQESKVTDLQAEQWLAAFAPWRSMVAAHLWAFQQAAA